MQFSSHVFGMRRHAKICLVLHVIICITGCIIKIIMTLKHRARIVLASAFYSLKSQNESGDGVVTPLFEKNLHFQKLFGICLAACFL